MKNQEYKVVIGTYSEPIVMGSGETVPGKGKGLYLCSFDGGRLKELCPVPMVNPSYACIDEERRIIYAVNEQKTFNGIKGGGYSQVRYDEKGIARKTAEGQTLAEDPCHITILPDKRFLSITNFSGQQVTFVPLDREGNVCPGRSMNYLHPGCGPEKSRQQKSHPHSTLLVPGERLLYIADLGEDRLAAYSWNEEKVFPLPEKDIHVTPGYGPRAGAFSGDGEHLYLICEIVNRVLHLAKKDGDWVIRQEESVVPEGHTGWSLSADLHLGPDGRTLYVSHRGSNTINVFGIREDGSMQKEQVISSGGEIPRMFNISKDGKLLLCGNQDSDSVAVFEIAEDGTLVQTGEFPFPTPVFIEFLEE